VDVDVVRALEHLDAARARADVGRDAVAEARERERIVRDRYDAGIAGVTDLLAATTASLDADARRVGALVDLLVARAELDHAVGRRPTAPK